MRIFAWGANTKGQLGLGYSSEQVSTPEEVSPFSNFNLNSIQGGGSFTIFIGDSTEDGSKIIHSFPQVETQTLQKPLTNAQNSEEEVWATGWDFSIVAGKKSIFLVQTGKEEVKDISGEIVSKIIQVSAGLRHAACIDEEGTLFVFGDNSKGQLGLGPNIKAVPEFSRVDTPIKFLKVRCGQNFTLAQSQDHHFYASGLNKWGQLSLSPTSHLKTTQFLKIPNFGNPNFKVKDFACGWNHVLILEESGKVLSWGRNNFGQLGRTTDSSESFTPDYVQGLPERISSIAVGSEHNLALGESGRVWSWGWNEHCNCGLISSDKDTDSVPLPTLLVLPVSVSYISCGAGNGFAVALNNNQ